MCYRIASAWVILVAAAALATAAVAQNPNNRKGKRERPREGKLQPGDDAPNFKLKKLQSDDEVELLSFRGKRPVVLVFGSYT